ncbi:MAG: nucleoside hydrolase, partial [Candidatus Omnitrophota bacterium]
AVHGKDGLGDTGLEPGPIAIEPMDALELAVSLIMDGRIDYIVATGPLTNIARIIEKIPGISKRIKGIYLMGGAIATEGNITPCAEFNIYCDPEAALSVFESDLPKTVVSLDVTRSVALDEDDIRVLSNTKNALSSFICAIASYSMEYNKRVRGIAGASLHDPLCVGVAIDESLCAYREGHFDIKLQGPERGMIVNGRNAVRYCSGVDAERFKKLLLTELTRLIKESEASPKGKSETSSKGD